LQDTNDRFLENIQRNGPRVSGGEITPDKLVVIGQVAQKYDLYTQITGGQHIDIFGAKKGDLPEIWELWLRVAWNLVMLTVRAWELSRAVFAVHGADLELGIASALRCGWKKVTKVFTCGNWSDR
jgi:sulfite reductase beta subunit-like hemoprotein